jgi:hypothetical protein
MASISRIVLILFKTNLSWFSAIDYINLLGENANNIKKKFESVMDPSKEAGSE